MPYAPLIKLGSFDTMPMHRRCHALQGFLEALALTDYQYLCDNPNTPSLYSAVPRYELKSRPWVMGIQVDEWKDIPEILATGSGDCKDFVAWRVAELRKKGHYDVEPYIHVWTPNAGENIIYHILVRQGLALEDPSKLLGMPTSLTPDEQMRVLYG